MKYNVALAVVWNNLCFEEVISSIASGLRELGHDVTTEKKYLPDATNIVVGFYLQFQPCAKGYKHLALPPMGSTIYQLEPYSAETVRAGHIPVHAMKPYKVWDYSRYNVSRLKEHDITAVYVAAGMYPDMTPIPGKLPCAPATQDIDVLFYGGMHARRLPIFAELRARGLNVVTVSGIYNQERAALIARAKVILNLHGHNDFHSQESIRLAYLLASKKAVVTEVNAGDDTDGFENSALCVPYGSLVDACVYLVKNDTRRRELEAAGYKYMRTRQMKDILKNALA